MSQGSWNELRELVLEGLRTLREQQQELSKRVTANEKDIAVLQTKVLVYTALITTILTAVLNWWMKK
jgi:hypothetical protein